MLVLNSKSRNKWIELKDKVGWAGICFVIGAIIGFYILSVVLKSSTWTHLLRQASAIDAIPKEVWATLGQERPAAVDLLNQVKNWSSCIHGNNINSCYNSSC